MLLPLLQKDNKWLDPRSFKDDGEFQRAYNIMWGTAQAYSELVTLLQGAEQRMRDIQARLEKEKLTHGI